MKRLATLTLLLLAALPLPVRADTIRVTDKRSGTSRTVAQDVVVSFLDNKSNVTAVTRHQVGYWTWNAKQADIESGWYMAEEHEQLSVQYSAAPDRATLLTGLVSAVKPATVTTAKDSYTIYGMRAKYQVKPGSYTIGGPTPPVDKGVRLKETKDIVPFSSIRSIHHEQQGAVMIVVKEGREISGEWTAWRKEYPVIVLVGMTPDGKISAIKLSEIRASPSRTDGRRPTYPASLFASAIAAG